MNWLDILLIVILAYAVAKSFWLGFSREAIGLAASIAALLLGIWFYGSAGEWLLPYVSSRGVANFCGFIIVFAGVLVVGSLGARLVNKAVKAAGLSWFDRMLGAAFGAVKGLLIAAALVMAIMAFTPGVRAGSPPPSVVQSRVAPYVIEAARLFASIAPYELKEGFRKTYASVRQIWRESVQGNIRELPAAKL
jgi:membrane protein required for colicin V production